MVEPEVYLVGLEDFPEPMLLRLQAFFLNEHRLTLGILPSMAVDDAALHPERRQLVAERVIESVDAARGGRDVVVVALTRRDIMMETRAEFPFVFALRNDLVPVALVSVARMDPRSFGQRPDEELLFGRMAKMVAKQIGVMYLRLPLSDDPRSVMYDRLTSLDALDRVADDFTLGAE